MLSDMADNSHWPVAVLIFIVLSWKLSQVELVRCPPARSKSRGSESHSLPCLQISCIHAKFLPSWDLGSVCGSGVMKWEKLVFICGNQQTKGNLKKMSFWVHLRYVSPRRCLFVFKHFNQKQLRYISFFKVENKDVPLTNSNWKRKRRVKCIPLLRRKMLEQSISKFSGISVLVRWKIFVSIKSNPSVVLPPPS